LPQISTVTGKRDNILQDGTYYEASVPPTGSAQYLSKLPIDYQSKNRYPDDPCNSWPLINRGSEQAFLMTLHKFSQKSQHPELVRIPWVLRGYSGGADWSIQMKKSILSALLLWF
jgi:hypothetical protein